MAWGGSSREGKKSALVYPHRLRECSHTADTKLVIERMHKMNVIKAFDSFSHVKRKPLRSLDTHTPVPPSLSLLQLWLADSLSAAND